MKNLKNTFVKILLPALSIFFITVTISCNKDDDAPAPAITPLPASDVFALGTTIPAEEAFFYKNEVKTILQVGANEFAQPLSMYVDGDDVYIAGSVFVIPPVGNNFTQLCYWKNGLKVNLTHTIPPAGLNHAQTFAITISNGVVYVLGFTNNTNSEVRSLKIWKDGVQSDFYTIPINELYAKAMFVKNNNIYVVGAISNGTIFQATYWVNGAATRISAVHSEATDITVDQNGVHLTFNENVASGPYRGSPDVVKYWKEGVISTVSIQRADSEKILVKGTDVYIAGNERADGSTSVFAACYWKNGVKTIFPGVTTLTCTNIKMGSNGDLFVASKLIYDGPAPLTYWQNNIKKTIGNSNESFIAFDINKK